MSRLEITCHSASTYFFCCRECAKHAPSCSRWYEASVDSVFIWENLLFFSGALIIEDNDYDEDELPEPEENLTKVNVN